MGCQEGQERVHGVNECGGLASNASSSGKCNVSGSRATRSLKPPPSSICPPAEMPQSPCKDWMGAQTTVQRWFVDPIEEVPLAEAKPFDCSRTTLRHPKETKGQDYDLTREGNNKCCDGGSCC